ncbi:MAG TPA: DUF4386 domain-containing protein [Verrucomicrobiae bacterium]|nr:DUF4386 domain-containing protein [Verrucomicrobiae bacterium]
MTARTNARLAGFTFLFYIILGIAGMVLFTAATGGQDTAATLASIASHRFAMGLSVVCGLLTILSALILGVTLYALTRDEDADLALLALTCRVVEGAANVFPVIAMVALIWIADTATSAASDPAAANGMAGLLIKVQNWSITVGATLFAIGSTIYSCLFLRARTIPRWLAQLGIISSILVGLVIPMDGVGLLKGLPVGLVWFPMLVFEVGLALRLLSKGTTPRPAA